MKTWEAEKAPHLAAHPRIHLSTKYPVRPQI